MTAATSINVRVPLTIRHGGRKLVIIPDGSVPGAGALVERWSGNWKAAATTRQPGWLG